MSTGSTVSTVSKTNSAKLHEIAKKTYDSGKVKEAKSVMLLALTSEDALDTLDKLMPQAPESGLSTEEIKDMEVPKAEQPPSLDGPALSGTQIAKIRGIVAQLEQRNKDRIATAILAKLDRIPVKRSRK